MPASRIAPASRSVPAPAAPAQPAPARPPPGHRVSARRSVSALTGLIGAEISGMNLAQVDDAGFDTIMAALLEHKVVFFRDQDLGPGNQVAFAQRLGPLTAAHPTMACLPGRPFLLEQDSRNGARADQWHSDVTFVIEPPAFTVLRAVVVPPHGGDTLWASTQAAYDRLPGPLQRLAGELHAIHTNAYQCSQSLEAERDGATRNHRETFASTVFESEHPVAQVHPGTGQPALLLGGFAKQLAGFPEEVSRDLLRIFASYVTRPEHIVRWRWRLGDVAVWDNRATQHYAVNDYRDAHRVMDRVTISGTRPVGVDGWTSRSRRGDASAYLAGIPRSA